LIHAIITTGMELSRSSEGDPFEVVVNDWEEDPPENEDFEEMGKGVECLAFDDEEEPFEDEEGSEGLPFEIIVDDWEEDPAEIEDGKEMDEDLECLVGDGPLPEALGVGSSSLRIPNHVANGSELNKICGSRGGVMW
jgi:hypothetical protein